MTNAPRLPAAGHYAKRWKAAKTKFKTLTGKKKPAPTKQVKIFTDKIATIEKREGTGIDKGIVAVEKLIPAAYKSQKGQDAYLKSYGQLEQKMSAYVRFLEQAIKTAPQDVDPKTWYAAVLGLKQEVRHIRLELKAHLDRAKQTQGNRLKAQQTANNFFQGLDQLITTADNWVGQRLQDTAPNTQEYQGTGLTHARNITQRLTNLHKLPILIDWQADHDRGPVPDQVEDTLEAFANNRRKFTNLEEYRDRLAEYREALRDLKRWLDS